MVWGRGPDPKTPVKPKKRDGNLVSLFRRQASEDTPSASPNSLTEGTPSTTPGSYNHRAPREEPVVGLQEVRRNLGFTVEANLEAQKRKQEETAVKAAEAKRRREEREAAAEAGGLCPETKGYYRGGRPKGSQRDPELMESHKRELGGPVLRRDPSAQEKLHYLAVIENKAAEQGIKIEVLASETKRALERRFSTSWFQLMKWFAQKALIEHFVATMRAGIHGLRPFGSSRATSYGSQSSGARLHELYPKEPTTLQPLNKVLWDLKVWFEQEREYNNEVRGKHFVRRLIFLMQAEQDKQTVLCELASEHYKASVLAACRQKLEFMKVAGKGCPQQRRFMDRVVKPYIGASARIAQHKVHESAKLDFKKALLSFEGFDYGMWLVGKGSEERLAMFVRDPASFVANRKETVLVVIDETGIYLKLSGDEQVYVSERETLYKSQLQKLKNSLKKARGGEAREAALTKLKDFTEDPANKNILRQTEGLFTTAGDKSRMTHVTISAVKHLWDPSKEVVCEKPKQVLIVSARQHAQLKDMGVDEWLREVRYEKTDGTEFHVDKGAKIGQLMSAYRGARDNYADNGWTDEVVIVGQPKAWTDAQVCKWVSDHLLETCGYKQCMVNCDCLGPRWSEQSLLQHFYNQQILVPLAPDVTAILQEPDTHEHFPLKKCFKQIKEDLHHDLEAEARNQKKETPTNWGAYEVLWVVGRGLKKFKLEHPLVPLKGLIENQLLIIRQNDEGNFERIDHSNHESTRAIRDKMGIHRECTGRGINQATVAARLELFEAWQDNQDEGPSTPDWEWLHTKGLVTLHGDDVPQEPGPEDALFDFRFQDLDMSEHQKLMLQPIEKRIESVIYPAGIQARVRSHVKCQRRNRWASKFKGYSLGKSAKKWADRIKQLGLEKAKAELEKELGPTAKVAATTQATAKALALQMFKKMKLRQASSKRVKGWRKKKTEGAKGTDGEKKDEEDTEGKEGTKKDTQGTEKKVTKDVEVPDSPWMGKAARVQGEGAAPDLLGRVGVVTRDLVMLQLSSLYFLVFDG